MLIFDPFGRPRIVYRVSVQKHRLEEVMGDNAIIRRYERN